MVPAPWCHAVFIPETEYWGLAWYDDHSLVDLLRSQTSTVMNDKKFADKAIYNEECMQSVPIISTYFILVCTKCPYYLVLYCKVSLFVLLCTVCKVADSPGQEVPEGEAA